MSKLAIASRVGELTVALTLSFAICFMLLAVLL